MSTTNMNLDTSIVQQFQVEHVIDVKTAVQILGDNNALFFNLLSKFEDDLLLKSLECIEVAIYAEDFSQVDFHAQKLKGSCAYIGAYRLFYACHFIQHFYHTQDFAKVVDYYS